MYYQCQICSYETNINSNYKKHLLTKKHNLNLQLKSKFNDNSSEKKKKYNNVALCSIDVAYTKNGHQCQYCLKCYKHHSSLYRHHKDCKYKELYDTNIICNSILQTKKIDVSNKIHKDPENIKNINICDKNYICKFCQNSYSNCRSLSKHIRSCSVKVLNDQHKNIILMKDLEKEKAINHEKDKIIELAKKSTNNITTNITNNNNSINYLNTHYGNMIAMEQFLYNLEHNEKLTLEERNNLLISYKENGIEVFARSFSYIMKQNCKRQLENKGISDMKLLPLFCSDGNLRSHKEKDSDGWKTHYDNKSINQMLNISNNQVYEIHNEMIPIIGKERTKIYKEIKRDNHQNKLKLLK